MKTLALASLATLGLAFAPASSAPLAAQEAKPEAPSLRERFATLKAEFVKAQSEFFKLYQEAKTDAEKEKLSAEKYPKPEGYVPRFRALAEENPKDPAAADCLVWIVQAVQTPAEQEGALDLLLRDHLESPALGEACQALVYSASLKADAFLRTVRSKSPHEEVRGRACYALAKLLHRRGEPARTLKEGEGDYAKFYPREFLDSVRATGAEAFATEAEKFLEEVVAKHGSLKSGKGTLGAAAERDLFEIRNLVVGKPAPEIEGEDAEGKRFRLSEHRGKVVFLDFWGYW